MMRLSAPFWWNGRQKNLLTKNCWVGFSKALLISKKYFWQCCFWRQRGVAQEGAPRSGGKSIAWSVSLGGSQRPAWRRSHHAFTRTTTTACSCMHSGGTYEGPVDGWTDLLIGPQINGGDWMPLNNRHTILWVTHQHDQAQSIADRVLVIENRQVAPLSAPILRPVKPSFTKVLQNVQRYPV